MAGVFECARDCFCVSISLLYLFGFCVYVCVLCVFVSVYARALADPPPRLPCQLSFNRHHANKNLEASVSGRALAHVETNYGAAFPTGWVYTQGNGHN